MAHRELQPPQRALFVMPWVGRVGQEHGEPRRHHSVDKDVTFDSPAGGGALDMRTVQVQQVARGNRQWLEGSRELL